MVAHVATVAFLGLETRAVECQVQIAAGLPKFLNWDAMSRSSPPPPAPLSVGPSNKMLAQDFFSFGSG